MFASSGRRPSRSSVPFIRPVHPFIRLSVRLPSAYLVQEQHDFMETVQLKGLKYDSALQNVNSGYYILLSTILKSTVSPHWSHWFLWWRRNT